MVDRVLVVVFFNQTVRVLLGRFADEWAAFFEGDVEPRLSRRGNAEHLLQPRIALLPIRLWCHTFFLALPQLHEQSFEIFSEHRDKELNVETADMNFDREVLL
ncbi:hypothetical protein ZIOFF_062504 [Zingiber officinale]|uniref:Uncharacterized protein n=1 Tax=Zingiber officinale TaxID=94328 RepID=A0A8J5F560_ZINOF|nr:hypothetical protein ZIOFF_062504 [Zingiber officinale]